MNGLQLSEAYYVEAVRPVLDDTFPDLSHSAALLGPGSEVLGFDDETSRDHHWGPRVDLYLAEDDKERYAEAILQALAHRLPTTFRGYSTHFEERPSEPGTLFPRFVEHGPVRPFVHVITVRDLSRKHLGAEPDGPLEPIDWLTFSEQRLRSIAAGAVFYDGLGALGPLRRRFAYYPNDVWLYLLAAAWRRIGQEEAFVGRAGFVGDELGSAVIGARLVRDVMRLAFLLERTYAPYSKWFGTAFARLQCAERLTPHLLDALAAGEWRTREARLGRAYEVCTEIHNALGITEEIHTTVSSFHSRPFQVIHGEDIADAVTAAIQDEEVRRLPLGVGGVDQVTSNTDILSYTRRSRRLRALYCP